MAAEAGQVPFKEAIDFFSGKVNLPTKRWDDLRHGAHVRAFSVAGMTRDDMLSELRAALAAAQQDGTGLKAFQDTFDDLVKRTGWKFYGRGATDEERSAWRARLIYKTNMRVSYMAGRYKQMIDPDVLAYRPYWQYKHSGALHPRKLHLSWNGLVLAATDPAWKVMFPPNGWGCGCDVIALSKRQLAALGKSGPDQSPLESYQDADPRTGQPETRYVGIDRGWEYNAGEEWLNGLVPKELRTPLAPMSEGQQLDLPALPQPQKVPAAKLLPDDLPQEDYIARFLDEFGIKPGEAGYFRDKSGGILTIGRSMFEKRDQGGNVIGIKSDKRERGPFMVLLADAIKDPDEIWIDWAAVASGVVLKRAYLKRFVLDDARELFLRFEWTKWGWIARTGFVVDKPPYLDKYRTGVLIYRK